MKSVENNLSENRSPLVSIIVITYNSERYVLETLESAKSQTYQNIELIISDDGSTDKTVEICKEWLDYNQERFIRTEILTIEKNSGIPSNCNRGTRVAKGDWLKLIAGDDMLCNKCIEENIEFSKKSNCLIFFSQLYYFKEDEEQEESRALNFYINKFITKNQIKKKFSYLRDPIFLNIPSLFYHTSVLRTVGGYDENFTLLEDQPFLLKVLLNNYDIGYLKKTTVKYRIHNYSVVAERNMVFLKDLFLSYKTIIRPNLRKYNIVDSLFKINRDLYFFFLLKDNSNPFILKLLRRSYSLLRRLD